MNRAALAGQIVANCRDLAGQIADLEQRVRTPGRTRPGPTVSPRLQENLAFIRQAFGQSPDLKVRELRCGPQLGWRAAVVYLDGLVDKRTVFEDITKPLVLFARDLPALPAAEAPALMRETIFPAGDVDARADLAGAIGEILGGKAALLVDGAREALLFGVQGWEHRNVEEPENEAVVRGPRSGFVETLLVNIMLMRRAIPSARLWVEVHEIGTVAPTKVAILSVQGIANPSVLEEVRRRLRAIRTEWVVGAREIEEQIGDRGWSLFPTVDSTERPDRVAAALLEGRVAILVDGSPFQLIVPTVLWHALQSPEDYSTSFYFSVFTRFMRLVGLLAGLLLTPVYVALGTYHHQMIPTTLALSMLASRVTVPFPTVVEAVMLELILEGLREAGLRLTRVAGQAVSIVGGLVIGEAAVRAGLVSPLLVIIVAAGAIASFTMPTYVFTLPIRLLRFAMIALAGTFGLLGILSGLMLLLFHLASLRSFGVPFLAPIAPSRPPDMRDVLTRPPSWLAGGAPLQPRRGAGRVSGA